MQSIKFVALTFLKGLNWNFFCEKDYLHINKKNALGKKCIYVSPQKEN